MTDLKPLNTLTLQDLTNHFCWKHFTLDNVEYVSPVDKREISENDADNYVVRTQFILPDNTEYVGFCSPQDTSGLDYVQPTIVTINGHLPFYFYKLDNISFDKMTQEIIHKNHEDIFPIVFETEVKCDGQFYKGRIENLVTNN